jgi:hypothetical protein
MKRLSKTPTKKRAASRPPVWVASSDHVLPPLSVVQRTTSLCVIRINLAMPIRRVANLSRHYSIYGIRLHCQGRACAVTKNDNDKGVCEKFPR